MHQNKLIVLLALFTCFFSLDVSDQDLNSLDLIKTDYTKQDMQDLANI